LGEIRKGVSEMLKEEVVQSQVWFVLSLQPYPVMITPFPNLPPGGKGPGKFYTRLEGILISTINKQK
jgi:hypothetical protein